MSKKHVLAWMEFKECARQVSSNLHLEKARCSRGKRGWGTWLAKERAFEVCLEERKVVETPLSMEVGRHFYQEGKAMYKARHGW